LARAGPVALREGNLQSGHCLMRWSSEKFGVQSQAARWMRDGSVEAKKKRLLWTLLNATDALNIQK
jgi:hypothetical protein